GVADMRQQTYYGRVVNRAARVRAVAHGGQIILSRATRELLDPKVFPTLKDHGLHRLKDLQHPEALFELQSTEVFPPLQTLSQRRNTLPIQSTSFVGRSELLEEVSQALARSPMVTLIGPGGSGKTRLALQASADLSDKYEGGVFFADLSRSENEAD